MIVAAIGILVGFCIWNYRRIYPRVRPLGANPSKIQVQKLCIPWDGHMLYGELLMPSNGGNKLPTVICSHGFNGSYRYFRSFAAPSLASAGYAVYCFDFYAGSRHGKSSGSMQELSVFMERDQLNAVIEFIKVQSFVDLDNLFLFGESQGGFVTAITAAEHTEDVKAIILYYPAFCIQDDMLKRYRTPEELPEKINFMGITLGKVYYEKLFGYQPYAVAGTYKRNVLVVHGDSDRTVDISYGKEAAACYKNARLEVLPRQDHGFNAKGKQDALTLTYDFLEKEIHDVEYLK